MADELVWGAFSMGAPTDRGAADAPYVIITRVARPGQAGIFTHEGDVTTVLSPLNPLTPTERYGTIIEVRLSKIENTAAPATAPGSTAIACG